MSDTPKTLDKWLVPKDYEKRIVLSSEVVLPSLLPLCLGLSSTISSIVTAFCGPLNMGITWVSLCVLQWSPVLPHHSLTMICDDFTLNDLMSFLWAIRLMDSRFIMCFRPRTLLYAWNTADCVQIFVDWIIIWTAGQGRVKARGSHTCRELTSQRSVIQGYLEHTELLLTQ